MQLSRLDILISLMYFAVIMSLLWFIPDYFKMGHFVTLTILYLVVSFIVSIVRGSRDYT